MSRSTIEAEECYGAASDGAMGLKGKDADLGQVLHDIAYGHFF